MNLEEKISLFYKNEYGIPDIHGIIDFNIEGAVSCLNLNFSLDKRRLYFQLYNLIKFKDTSPQKDFAVIFLKGSMFPSDEELIASARGWNGSEKSIQIFFSCLARGGFRLARSYFVSERNYAKNFLRKALEHKLICENPNLWKKPDNSISHLRLLSDISSKLAYLEDNLDERSRLLKLNYNTLLRKGDTSKIDYDEGPDYLRRLFECTINLAVCAFDRNNIEEAKNGINISLNYFNKIRSDCNNIPLKSTKMLYVIIGRTIDFLYKKEFKNDYTKVISDLRNFKNELEIITDKKYYSEVS